MFFFSDINECESSPCQNRGTCVDEINKYYCTCTNEWHWPHCEGLVNFFFHLRSIGLFLFKTNINYCAHLSRISIPGREARWPGAFPDIYEIVSSSGSIFPRPLGEIIYCLRKGEVLSANGGRQ